MCDFVTFCPNCGFNIKSFRKKTRDQQMGDYFRKMYSHAPKNDEGFAKSENDEADVFTASQDIAAFPKSSGYPAVNNDTVQYGDGFLLSSANAANKKKMSRKSRFFLLVTLIILLPCLAAVLIFSMVISQNKEDDVKAQRASRLSLSRENNQTVTIEPGVIRYVDNNSVRCTFKSNTDDHIFAVVNNGTSDNNRADSLSFVSMQYGTGEYMGRPEMKIEGYVECDDSINMKSINTGYKFIKLSDDLGTNCEVSFTIVFDQECDGLFIYDVDFSDTRASCRALAVPVRYGKCVAVVNCSEISDTGSFSATLVPKGFVPNDDEIYLTERVDSDDVFFYGYDQQYTSVVNHTADISHYLEDSGGIVLYQYENTKDYEAYQNGIIERSGFSFVKDPQNVNVLIIEEYFGSYIASPEYMITFFGRIKIK